MKTDIIMVLKEIDHTLEKICNTLERLEVKKEHEIARYDAQLAILEIMLENWDELLTKIKHDR